MMPEASSPSDLCESGSAADSDGSVSELEFETASGDDAASAGDESPGGDVATGDQTLADVCSRNAWMIPGVILSRQCKAFVGKAYTMLRAWPTKLKSEILAHWNIGRLPVSINKATAILMVMFGASRKRIDKVVRNKQNLLLHCPRDSELEERVWAPKASPQRGLEYLVEMVCACACEG